MNKKYIKLIGIVNSILATILGGISIHEKSKITLILVIIFSFLAILAFLIYYIALWKVSEREKKSLKKNLRKEKAKNQKQRGKTCQECTKIYVYSYPDDEWVSFKENPSKDEYFSLIENLSDNYEERSVYHFDSQWIFISFWGEENDYLIDLVGKSIYLPIGKWEESKRDSLTSYKILCSKRRENHFGFDEIDKLI